MRIAVICPFSRPKMALNVRSNWARQKIRATDCVHLAVVENGAGIGVWTDERDLTVLQSERHQSTAKNIGIAWAKKLGFDAFATFDDDDYYGPNYLTDTIRALEHSQTTGVAGGWVAHGERLLLACAPAGSSVFWGPTIASRLDASVPMFPRERWGEDVAWCIESARRGRTYHARDSTGFCWRRYDATHGHTYPILGDTHVAILGSYGPVFYAGPYDEAVINGTKQIEPVALPHLDPSLNSVFAAVKAAKSSRDLAAK